ncbi:hypothetical protein FHT70_002582 [Rhizobium sp. BK049]|uniref:hypothetical protein n=1 Tax=Rhizobium sp. BK049 TaxID=2587095 RepID=UPI00183A3DBF|nr:hypothetical protein [Rhizobium sp. BK049]MBB3352649.1 hypothetical protein [Rhizobium sp. BK049]
MRLVINMLVAAVMLLGSLAAPCIPASADHSHARPAVVSVAATADGHHRGDGRSVLGTHCQQDGIVSRASELLYSHSDAISYVVAPSVAFVGAQEPVEQRPPIASV